MAVGWSAKKQGSVSLSTMKAESVAASDFSRELLGVRKMLSKIGMAPELPMLMHVNNQAAIRQIEGEVSSLKAKYIDVRVELICDFARRGIVRAQYVRSELMLADLLTKALDPPKLATLLTLVQLD